MDVSSRCPTGDNAVSAGTGWSPQAHGPVIVSGTSTRTEITLPDYFGGATPMILTVDGNTARANYHTTGQANTLIDIRIEARCTNYGRRP